MITLLRKIRKNLLDKGNFTSYLFYAIGEILLVVIGILLALQINNWNEARKARAFEKEILTQIQLNLQKDRQRLIEVVDVGIRARASIEKILNVEQGESSDSLNYWLGNIIRFARFQPLTNAYEALKSKGLDLIQNKELRFLLGSYYDDKLKLMDKSNQDVEWSFLEEWLPLVRKQLIEFRFGEYVELEDDQLFYKAGAPRNLLKMNKENWSGNVNDIQSGVEVIDRILELIKKELN